MFTNDILHPQANPHDYRSLSQTIREDNMKILILNASFLVLWIISIFCGYATTKTGTPFLYWLFIIIGVIGKWGLILGAIWWILREIKAFIVQRQEKALRKSIEENEES